MPRSSADEQRTIEDMAERQRVSLNAVVTLLVALQAGEGHQAQFSHPGLGGMGQWSLGGLVMIGDMSTPGQRRVWAALARHCWNGSDARRIGLCRANAVAKSGFWPVRRQPFYCWRPTKLVTIGARHSCFVGNAKKPLLRLCPGSPLPSHHP